MAPPAETPWGAFWSQLIVVTCMWYGPFTLLFACVGVGAPQGIFLQFALFWWTLIAICCTMRPHQHLLVVSVPAAFAAMTPPSWSRCIAMGSMVHIMIYGWCTSGEEYYKQRPGLFRYIQKWGPHWFAETALRGELPDGCTSKCCFCYHPHGICPFGYPVNGWFHPYFHEKAGRVNWITSFRQRYGSPTFRWLVESIWSDTFRCHDSSRDTIKKIMEVGENIGILPGATEESRAYEYGKQSVGIRKRGHGLVKYCLQSGYRMFPVYTFGETCCYKCYFPSSLRDKLFALANSSPALVLGCRWPPLPFMPMKDARLITYIGPPLELPHIEDPTQEDIDHWHAKYVEALTALFDEKKAEAGYPDAVLEFPVLGEDHLG